MNAKLPKRPRDPNQLAKFVVDVATGAESEKEKSASAVKGGLARSKNLTERQRAEIAQQAAQARWKKSD